jgi:hypothetical protein
MSGIKHLMAKIRQWWRRIQPFIEEYQQETIEDHRYRGTRRAERELRGLGFDPISKQGTAEPGGKETK